MPKNDSYEDQKKSYWAYQDYFDLPNPGLRSYFERVRKGQPKEYRTTFAEGESLSAVLQEWEPTLMTIADDWPTLVEFESDLRTKVGPMSIMKPLSERMDDIDHYYDDIQGDDIRTIQPEYWKRVLDEFAQVRGTEVRSQEKTVSKMKLSTNSGCPFFTKRRNVIHSTIPVKPDITGNKGHLYLGQNLHGIDWGVTAILGWRGQEGGPSDADVKQRVVWMFPFGVNVLELQAYQPLIEQCQKFNLVPAWVSMDAVDQTITRMFDTKGKDDLVVCTDFTRFDQHFNGELQEVARYIMQGLLNTHSSSVEWIEQVFPIKYNIPLNYDWAKIRYGHHGMGSGSGGTNFDETLVHRALQYEAAMTAGQDLNIYSQCLGDDGVLTYPKADVDHIVYQYSRHGLDMNIDKQYASTDDCTYLRRWHHTNYRVNGISVGVYSTYRAIGRLCEQERYYNPEDWGREQVALRQLSILENVKWHPLRDQFAQFCMRRDKYRLGIDIPGFLDNVDRIAKESIDNMPDFLGFTKSNQINNGGIKSWWIVNYLKNV